MTALLVSNAQPSALGVGSFRVGGTNALSDFDDSTYIGWHFASFVYVTIDVTGDIAPPADADPTGQLSMTVDGITFGSTGPSPLITTIPLVGNTLTFAGTPLTPGVSGMVSYNYGVLDPALNPFLLSNARRAVAIDRSTTNDIDLYTITQAQANANSTGFRITVGVAYAATSPQPSDLTGRIYQINVDLNWYVSQSLPPGSGAVGLHKKAVVGSYDSSVFYARRGSRGDVLYQRGLL